MSRIPDVSRRSLSTLIVLAVMALVLSLGWVVVRVGGLANEVRILDVTVEQQDSALGEANRRLSEGGEDPVPVPAVPSVVGPQGEVGRTGPRGLTGATGPEGEQGERGPTGRTGPAGPAGEPGESGEMGEQGVSGAKGEVGPPGEKGEAGSKGGQGDRGVAGPAGPQGPPGTQGSDGQDSTIPGPAGQSALPFTFTFVVLGQRQDTRYTVVCDLSGCTVEATPVEGP